MQRRDSEFFQLAPDGGYLTAIGHNHADGLPRIEMGSVETVDAPQKVGNNDSLDRLTTPLARRSGGVDKEHPVRLETVVNSIFRRFLITDGSLLLMWQGNRFQPLVCIEHAIGKLGDVGMHATLLAKDTDEVGATALPLPPQQPFKQRLTAIIQADFPQQRVIDSRLAGVLLHDGRQLLVVADKNELLYRAVGKQSHDVRLQNLTRFIDDSQRETLH